MWKELESSPVNARVAPFIIFLGLTWLQNHFGEAGRYWIYAAKTGVGAWMLWQLRGAIAEMRWAFSWEAVGVGVAVFVMWVGLDDWLKALGCDSGFHRQKNTDPPWNPNTAFGAGSVMAWFFVAVRIAGSSLVVPPLEEVFYRSFLYRFIRKGDFLSVPIGQFVWFPFLAGSALFSVSHHEWLAALLCGCAFQGLAIWKDRIGDAMTAHAITNFLLGLWIVWKNDWKFW
ncbi:MAG TPA: CAAX prenyl protease-related protein [Verrucomicrobiae bacterium]